MRPLDGGEIERAPQLLAADDDIVPFPRHESGRGKDKLLGAEKQDVTQQGARQALKRGAMTRSCMQNMKKRVQTRHPEQRNVDEWCEPFLDSASDCIRFFLPTPNEFDILYRDLFLDLLHSCDFPSLFNARITFSSHARVTQQQILLPPSDFRHVSRRVLHTLIAALGDARPVVAKVRVHQFRGFLGRPITAAGPLH